MPRAPVRRPQKSRPRCATPPRACGVARFEPRASAGEVGACWSLSNERLLPCPAGPPSSDPRARGQLVPKGVNDAPESRLLWIPLSVTTRTSRVPRLVRDAEIACAEPTVALAVVHVAPALVVTARCPVPVTPVAVESSARSEEHTSEL